MTEFRSAKSPSTANVRAAMRIWDLHTHLTLDADSPVGSMEKLLVYSGRMGIDRLVVYMGRPGFVGGRPADVYRDRDPTPEDLRAQNNEVLKVVEAFPTRTVGFVYLNLNHLDFSIEELNRTVAEGPLVGIKLWTAARLSTPEHDPLIARATELNVPIFQHTWLKVGGDPPYSGGGSLEGETRPWDIAEVARRHPEAKLIMGHSGGDWEVALRAIRNLENVSIGLAGFDPTAGVTEKAVEELGPHRIIYGSDAGGRSFGSQLAKVYGARISDEDKKMIFSNNLIRLLRPALEKKGIPIDN